MNETEEPRAARKRFQAQYRALYDEVLEILFQIDPIGVDGQDNTEKFVPEASSIGARLREARIAEDVETIVKQELRQWYGCRRLAHEDHLRLTRATIAICSARNRFLDPSTL